MVTMVNVIHLIHPTVLVCRRWLVGGSEGERVLVKCGMGCGGEMGWGGLEWGGGRLG